MSAACRPPCRRAPSPPPSRAPARSSSSREGRRACERGSAPQGVIALREQELDELESETAALRKELESFYEDRAAANGRTLTKQSGPKAPVGILAKGAGPGLQPGSGQRVAWGASNKVGHFTKGSSPREFGNKMRHDQMRNESLGIQPPPPPAQPPTR